MAKHLAEATRPKLYESITFRTSEVLHSVDLAHKINVFADNKNVKFRKNICLEAPSHGNLRKRCPHHHTGVAVTRDEGNSSNMSERSDDTIEVDTQNHSNTMEDEIEVRLPPPTPLVEFEGS